MPVIQTKQSKILSWYEDFESYPTGTWSGGNKYIYSFTSTEPTIETGKFLQKTGVGLHSTNVFVRGFNHTNLRVSYEGMCIGDSTNEQITMFLRYQIVDDTHLTVRLVYDGTPGTLRLNLAEVISGSGTGGDNDTFSGSLGTWYYIEAEVVGTSVTAVAKDITQTTTLATASLTTTLLTNPLGSGWTLASGDGGTSRINNVSLKAL